MRDFQNDTGGYPLGTLTMYGPNRARATKYAAVVMAAPDSASVALKRWFITNGDIRTDTQIAKEVSEFFKAHNARRTLMSDRITGCPHEEGVDYPLGGVCPDCPFWAETDRFTDGPKAPADDRDASGYISADEIIIALSEARGQPPREAFKAADVRRKEITDRLLAVLEAGLVVPSEASAEVSHLFCHALYLLAKWREPRAFPFVLRLLSLPGDSAFDLAGDVPHQDGARILASVCGGDRPEIRALIENRKANEYCRSIALDSLAVLAAWGELPRETVIACLRELITGKLEREHSFLWDEIACLIADLDAGELVELIRGPYEEGLVDSGIIGWDEIENRTSRKNRPPSDEYRHRHPPITDVAQETGWWAMYDRVAVARDEPREVPKSPDTQIPGQFEPSRHEAPAPFVAAPKTGRNDQCPCGSGKKYKKCCGKNA